MLFVLINYLILVRKYYVFIYYDKTAYLSYRSWLCDGSNSKIIAWLAKSLSAIMECSVVSAPQMFSLTRWMVQWSSLVTHFTNQVLISISSIASKCCCSGIATTSLLLFVHMLDCDCLIKPGSLAICTIPSVTKPYVVFVYYVMYYHYKFYNALQ